jgi:hypothetical protein
MRIVPMELRNHVSEEANTLTKMVVYGAIDAGVPRVNATLSPAMSAELEHEDSYRGVSIKLDASLGRTIRIAAGG